MRKTKTAAAATVRIAKSYDAAVRLPLRSYKWPVRANVATFPNLLWGLLFGVTLVVSSQPGPADERVCNFTLNQEPTAPEDERH